MKQTTNVNFIKGTMYEKRTINEDLIEKSSHMINLQQLEMEQQSTIFKCNIYFLQMNNITNS
jgi:hypothetical protein